MINISDRIVIREVKNLGPAIDQGIKNVLAHLETRYGQAPTPFKWDSPHGFQYLFSSANIRSDRKFGESFLDTALAFSAMSSRSESLSELLKIFDENLNGLRPAASAIPSLKQGIKLLLVELWRQQVLLLPSVFLPAPHFEPVPFRNELFSFIKKFDPKNPPVGIAAADARRLYYLMPRVFFSASWRLIEDVSINELSELQRAKRLFMTGQSETPIITSPVPWVLFLVEIKKAFPDRVNYTDDDIKKYSQWIFGSVAEQPFSEFIQKNKRTATESSTKRRVWNPNQNVYSEETIKEFGELAKSSLHEDALKYFKEFSVRNRGGLNWLAELPRYVGREHISLENVVVQWRKAFKAFLHHRKTIKGYEDEKGVTSSLNILADYLFLYLPWWKELYPNSDVPLPLAPKDFARYAYVYRSTEEPIEQFPATFPELLKLRRRTRDGQYAVLKHIQLFFRFVESSFSEETDVAGPEFRNPIFEEFDLPRVARRGKTSKLVFPKGSYSYLVHYGYAVEALGEYLLAKCIGNVYSVAELRRLSAITWLNTEFLGFVPFVLVKGKLTPIFFIPNVFTWVTRVFKNGKEDSTKRLVPHLTTIRVLIAAIETGLRLSSLRWLDQRTWDQENRGETDFREFSFQPSGRYIYRLFVNTDKTKDKPWITDIVFRVRSLLLRENAFQNSINEPEMQEPVPYKGREDSRFGRILPLFQGSLSPNPITENMYQDYWVLFLTGFQEFYSGILLKRTLFVKINYIPTAKNNDKPKIIVLENGTQYCPVSIHAINTPHACRATYATNRQGLIETSDIALQLGHNSTVVTGYYQSPRAEDLHDKLEATDRAIFNNAQRFEHDSASYIRPDMQDSAMARSFMANRAAAIQQFKVMPAMALWNSAETESMSFEAIEELRNGPMSLVRFHPTHICPVGDECPADIVKTIGDFKRCGICPLALKGIDHLQAIAAKKNFLLERIRYQLKQRDVLEKAGEPSIVEDLWDSIELDTNEWIGWQLSEEVLAKSYADLIASGDAPKDAVRYHADEPEIVRQYLQRVVRQSSEVEFLLCRIVESNAYPTMQTPQVQAVASAIRRRILGGTGTRDLLSELPGPADIAIAASLLKTVMQANQQSLAEVAKQLIDQPVFATTSHLRIGEVS